MRSFSIIQSFFTIIFVYSWNNCTTSWLCTVGADNLIFEKSCRYFIVSFPIYKLFSFKKRLKCKLATNIGCNLLHRLKCFLLINPTYRATYKHFACAYTMTIDKPQLSTNFPIALEKAIIIWNKPRWMKILLNLGFSVDWICNAIFEIAKSYNLYLSWHFLATF